MFGWFKRKSKPVMVAASWDYEPHKYASVWFKPEHRAICVLKKDRGVALDLIALIETAQRQKKRHSHLLEQLRALEVK